MPGHPAILAWILALPVAGIVAVLALPARLAARPWIGARAVALAFALGALLLAAHAAGHADFSASAPVRFRVLGLGLAADRLSLPLLLLAAALAVTAAWASPGLRHRPQSFFASLLIFLAAFLGALLAVNSIIYILMLIISGIALRALLAGWGADRRRAAARHFLYGALFAAAALLACLLLRLGAAAFTADPFAVPPSGAPRSPAAFYLFLLAAAALAAVLPAHWWLADAAAESATPVALLAAALWPTLGIYTLLRFSPLVVPPSSGPLAPLALLAAATLLYASLAALAQTNLKRLAAFFSIAFSAFTLLAAAAALASPADPAARAAVAHLLLARPLAIALFLLLAGILEQRLGHCDLPRLGGLAHHLPSLALWGALALLAATPALAAFPGTFLATLSAFGMPPSTASLLPPLAALAAFTLLLAAGLLAYHRTFLGPSRPEHSNIPRLSISERWILALLALASLALGLFPSLIPTFL